ncbi:MAG: hypothetical protein B9S34_02430 [Opitutia bacterium Tous-C1TDCM]|nr:MAG: hypothetical protein B9S34_02430 [Opitutae bacterium Tous-C1TDCM]
MIEPDPWPHFRRRAAAHLRGDLADRVVRRHRLVRVSSREAWRCLGLAALTAAACALVVVAVGERLVTAENARNFAAWIDVASQTNLVARLP